MGMFRSGGLWGACVAALAWRQAALPGEARVITAIERTFGAVRGDLQEAAARWSVAAPGQRLQIDDWEVRLALKTERHVAGERLLKAFLSFERNEHVEGGWPNGVFFDWAVIARPMTPIARLRRRLE